MLHRVLASLLCALGAAALGLGIASATLWRASDTLVAQAQAPDGTSMIVTDAGMLDLAAAEVTVRAEAASGTVVIALGRTSDVEAWVDGDAHTRVTGLVDWHTLATQDVAAAPVEEPADEATVDPAAPVDPAATADPAAAPDETAEATGDAAETTVPDPRGSDLWVEEVSASRSTVLEWTAQEGRWSVLVAATGSAPPRVVLEWPQVVTTPWLVPGVVVGSLLLVIGLAWWALILVAARRSAAVVAEEPVVVAEPAEPALPLTRRRLRELEEQRARTHGKDRETVTERFPMLVPGPRAQDSHRAPDLGRPSGPGATTSPATGSPATTSPVTSPAATDTAAAPESRRSRRAAAGGAPAGGAQERTEPAAPTKAPRSSRGVFRRRSAPEVEVVTPEPEPAPVLEPPHTGTPSASADAWRRTWGLSGDFLAEKPTEGTVPGARRTPGHHEADR